MCGIVGYSGKTKFDQNKIKILMLSNVVRGVDATGIYNNGKITKDILSAEKFLGSTQLVPENIFIGHTRKGTSGKNTVENAHPFQSENIVGVHNGGITYRYQIEKLLGISAVDYNVDSELIFIALSKAKFAEMMESFEGAAAVIWSDINFPERLYFYHNEERPLFYGMYNKESMYLSSIKESLLTIGCKEQNIVDVPIDKVFVVEHGIILEEECYDVKHTSTKITNTVVNSHSGSMSTAHSLIAGDYVTPLYKTSGLTFGEQYFVVDVNFYNIYIYNDNNRLVQLAARDFKEVPKPKEGDFVKCRFDVKTSHESGFMITSSDVMRITKIEKEWDHASRTYKHKASCYMHTSEMTGTIFTMPLWYVKKVTAAEETTYKSMYQKKKETVQLNLWENAYYSDIPVALDTLSNVKGTIEMVVASLSSNFLVADSIFNELNLLDSAVEEINKLEQDMQNNVDFFDEKTN